MSFGQRLKTIRKSVGLTQADLADKLMVSVQSVSKWECGNSMPDISQIVPLAAVLGVTTDCLLGADGDEAADRKKLFVEIEQITKGIEKVYSRDDNAYYACYMLYQEHIKKYPLDFEVKFLCADSLIRVLYYGQNPTEEKDKLYLEAERLLQSVITYDRDTTRVIDAKQTLIILYLYRNDFANAEHIAEGLPKRGCIRDLMEIEIYSKKNDQNRCLEIADRMCHDALHDYLHALAVRARRISIAGDETNAITAWHHLIDSVKQSDGDLSVHTKWLYSAMNHLANKYIALSEIDKAFDVIGELTDTLILDYRACLEKGDQATAAELGGNFKFYLHSCYNLCFDTEDNIITEDARFRAFEQKLDCVKSN